MSARGVEAVLAAHDDWHLTDTGAITCKCGFALGVDTDSIETWEVADRAHVAAVLLESEALRGLLATAWDEGATAAHLFERGEVYPEPKNPHRLTAAAERRGRDRQTDNQGDEK